MTEEKYDAIIVGAGFGGIYNLVQLREVGLRCKLIEAGSDFGGTWYWNTCPGARVDTEIPIYEFSRPELWKGWTWTENFPGWKELQSYFAYVADKLDLRKHCRFDSRIKQAYWDDRLHIWHVASDEKGGEYRAVARHLVMCMGTTTKPYTPTLKGLESFQGVLSHTARWPKEGIKTGGKRVGIIGTGASGVQVIQKIGQHVEQLTVFQRTPNLATPMEQYRVSKQVQDHFKPVYAEVYQKLPTTFSGLSYGWIPRLMMEDSEEEREATFEALWDHGGFHFWIANYRDLLFDKDSNNAAYAFWRKKVSERIRGFDTFVGAFLDLDLRGINGETIQDHWRDGIITYLGMTIDNFPNLWFVYGPQGPTALSNGPSCIEMQGSWIRQTIEYLRQHGITKFTPNSHAAWNYEKHINVLSDASLFPLANSWYNGANIPGKQREAYNYMGGLCAYKQKEIEKDIRVSRGKSLRTPQL